MSPRRPPAWPGSPLALQLMALLVGSLIVAQVVTLALSVLLPPAPAPEYRLPDVAAALRGETGGRAGPRPLVRAVRAAPPALSGPSWLISEASRTALARQLGADPRDVRLASFMPPPFAGAPPPGPPELARVASAPEPSARFGGLLVKAAYLNLAQAGGLGGGRFGDGAAPLGGPPGDGSFSGPTDAARDPATRGGIGGGGRGQAGRGRGQGGGASGGTGQPGGPPDRQQESFRRRFEQQAARSDAAVQARAADPVARAGEAATPGRAAAVAARSDPLLGAVLRDAPRAEASAAVGRGGAMIGGSSVGFGVITSEGRRLDPGAPTPSAAGAPDQPWPYAERTPEPAPPTITKRSAQTAASAEASTTASPAPQLAQAAPLAAVPPPAPAASATAEPLTDAAPPRLLQNLLPGPVLALFRRPPAPFVQGDFVAAYRIADQRWAVVRPEPEPFPNAWQRRLMLWFALSFAIVGPLGLFYIRRIVQPLGAFAEAAEQLGRDPGAPAAPLQGPAEIGRAARALNRMQSRIGRFVADRTAMIGAISHDLRTPLTRMRFRLEEAPDAVREGMLEEVEEMEAMISSVLDFLHQASEQGPRKPIDVAPLVEDVVEDFGLIGADVALAARAPAVVEADALSIRRVVTNLVDNAVKYGERARISLRTEADEAVIEILDDGPGLPAAELDRVFQPFYRTAEAQTSGKKGVGLGLAACRSIARAHGGEVRFVRAGEGRSELRLPLVAATAA